jgi:DNA topoisomerase IA
MQLMIVDSYVKKKALQTYCASDWHIVVSLGRICDLPIDRLGVNLDDFKPDYKLLYGAIPFIKSLNELASCAEQVWLAMDVSREGEILAQHLVEHLIAKSVKRIVLTDISKEGVTNALNNPKEISQYLCDAWSARRVIDRLIGYKVSQALTQRFQEPVAIGRVQAIVLKLIVKREQAFCAYQQIKNTLHSNNKSKSIPEKSLDSNFLKRFDEWSLMLALEKEGVLCAKTLISTLNSLQRHGYIAIQNDFFCFYPTPFGEQLIDLLEDKFKFLDFSYNRDLENALENLSQGKEHYFYLVNTVNDELQKGLGLLRDSISLSMTCPRCQSPVKQLRDQYGYFKVCSRYREGCTGSKSENTPGDSV